jgi:ABC-type sugar transport system ATPase subunit
VSDLIKNGGFNPGKLNKVAARYCTALNIRTSSLGRRAGELSGGNQQKLLIARWLNTRVDVLIMDEPTQGIDVGAKFEIYQIMRKFVNEGRSILVISSEINELLNISDRIMVIKQGKCVQILEAKQATEEQILSLAMR